MDSSANSPPLIPPFPHPPLHFRLTHIVSFHLHLLHHGSELVYSPAPPSPSPIALYPLVAPALFLLLPLQPCLHTSFCITLPLCSYPPAPLLPYPMVLDQSYPIASVPRCGLYPLCRPQDLRTVGGYHTPYLPDPPLHSLIVRQWLGEVSPLFLQGAPLGAYPVQRGDMLSDHCKKPWGVGVSHPVRQIGDNDYKLL